MLDLNDLQVQVFSHLLHNFTRFICNLCQDSVVVLQESFRVYHHLIVSASHSIPFSKNISDQDTLLILSSLLSLQNRMSLREWPEELVQLLLDLLWIRKYPTIQDVDCFINLCEASERKSIESVKWKLIVSKFHSHLSTRYSLYSFLFILDTSNTLFT